MFPGLQTPVGFCNCEFLPAPIGVIILGLAYKLHHDMNNFRRDIMLSLDTQYNYSILWHLQPLNSHQGYIDRVTDEEYINLRDSFSREFDHYNRYRLRTLQTLGTSLILALISLAMSHVIGVISVYFNYSILAIQVISILVLLIASRYMMMLYEHKNSLEEFIDQNQEELIDMESRLVGDHIRMGFANIKENPIKIQDLIDQTNENSRLVNFLFGCSIGGTIGFLIAGGVGSILLGALIGMLSLQDIDVESIIDWT